MALDCIKSLWYIMIHSGANWTSTYMQGIDNHMITAYLDIKSLNNKVTRHSIILCEWKNASGDSTFKVRATFTKDKWVKLGLVYSSQALLFPQTRQARYLLQCQDLSRIYMRHPNPWHQLSPGECLQWSWESTDYILNLMIWRSFLQPIT